MDVVATGIHQFVGIDLAETAFVGCRFDDDVWFIAGTNHDRQSLKWSSIALANGTPFCDPINAELLTASKQLLALIGSGAVARGRKPRGSSLVSHFYEIKRLVLWMSARKLRRFADFTLPRLVAYRDYLRTRVVSVSSKDKESVTKPVAPATVTAGLQLLQFLVRLQGRMAGLGTRVDIDEADDLLRSGALANESVTPRIPDHVFRKLLSSATTFLRDFAPAVVQLEREFREWKGACVAGGLSYHAFSQFKVHGLKGRAEPRFIELNGSTVDLMLKEHDELRRILVAVRAACFILIAGFVGMRVSEIRSLRSGCLRCETLSDGRRLLRLHGTMYKTARSDEGEPAAWVAGWEASDNPVALAIETLETLGEGSGYLFGRLRGGVDRIIQTQTVHYGLEAFLELTKLPTDWHFASHQFRKTFARFVALSDPSGPVALMRHFKHVSMQMTERYFPNDPELISDIIEASEELVEEQLMRTFSADRLGGIRGKQIVANNHAYRSEDGAAELREVVKMTMADPGTHVVLHVYGMCFYDRDSARCGGDISEVGLSACVSCVNFATGEEHIPFWEEQQRLLTANIAAFAEAGVLRLELQRQLEETKDALARLK